MNVFNADSSGLHNLSKQDESRSILSLILRQTSLHVSPMHHHYTTPWQALTNFESCAIFSRILEYDRWTSCHGNAPKACTAYLPFAQDAPRRKAERLLEAQWSIYSRLLEVDRSSRCAA